jgi:hypothetical protein
MISFLLSIFSATKAYAASAMMSDGLGGAVSSSEAAQAQAAEAAAKAAAAQAAANAASAKANCVAGAICPVGTAPSTSNTSASLSSVITNLGSNILVILTLVAGVLAVIYLVWSGIQYITAGGSADKAKSARTGIINAVIGIVIIVAAYFIVRLSIGVGRNVACSDQPNTAAATCK